MAYDWASVFRSIDRGRERQREIDGLRAEVERLRKSRHAARHERDQAKEAARIAGLVNEELRGERDDLRVALERCREDLRRIRELASGCGLHAVTALRSSGVREGLGGVESGSDGVLVDSESGRESGDLVAVRPAGVGGLHPPVEAGPVEADGVRPTADRRPVRGGTDEVLEGGGIPRHSHQSVTPWAPDPDSHSV